MADDATLLTENATVPKEGAEGEASEAQKLEDQPTTQAATDGQADKAKDGEPGDKEADKPVELDVSKFEVPEGVEKDEEALKQYGELAKEFGLDQEKAQKLLNLWSEQAVKQSQEQVKTWNDLQDQWQEQVKSDKEIGGSNLQSTLADAKVALDKFGSEELLDALEITGAGNHPALVKAFAKMGRAIKEDTMRTGNSGDAKPRTMEEFARSLYPSMDK